MLLVITNQDVQPRCLTSLTVQWAPLNGITLGPRETDSYNRLILISKQTKHALGRKW
jgi:hypothetical protein